ncbi:MAG: hypothetical protein ABFC57_06260 [Veillonellales bacterium]
MYKKINQAVNDFRKIAREVPALVKSYEEEISLCEKAFLDIRHCVELKKGALTRRQKTLITRLTKEYSLRRRKASDNLRVLQPLDTFLTIQGHVLNRLDTTSGEMRKQISIIEGPRHYNPRVLNELFKEE